MSPRKEYFDKPVVRVDTLKARFPRICPVCGSPATKIVRMKIASDMGRYLRDERAPTLYKGTMVHNNMR